MRSRRSPLSASTACRRWWTRATSPWRSSRTSMTAPAPRTCATRRRSAGRSVGRSAPRSTGQQTAADAQGPREMTRRAVETDVCIVGSGISAAMVAERLARTTTAKILVIEAGDDTVPLAQRAAARERFVRYNENPWGRDHLEGYEVEGPLQSRSMQVGGLAMHWGAVTPRFSPEDFKQHSLYGVGTDWPISYEDLDPFYQEAEELMGVAGAV